MIKLEFTINGINEAISALRRIASRSFVAEQLEKAIPTLKSLQRDRFDRISRGTPYSPGYIGRLKPSKEHRAGVAGDPGYARDTSALYSDLTQNIDLEKGEAVSIWSDRAYAAYQEGLLNRNHGLSFFYEDAVYGDIAEAAIAKGINDAWGE
jgi:hypothetical protein